VPTSNAALASERSHLLLEEGDVVGALAAIEEAIASDPAFPNAHHFAGWILLQQPSPTPASLEAAARHFRAALESSPAPHSLCTLADTLVALGRADEAVATMEREGQRGPFAANAHNWLAWHFIVENDFAKAVPHGREATRLAPDTGLFWGTLGEALERVGADADAYKAYLEGLAVGGTRSPGITRRRAMALEAAMRARGEALPFLDPGSLAAKRTDPANEVARAILRGIMAMPEFAQTGRVLTLGRALPVPTGDVPKAWIGCLTQGRILACALVSDLSSHSYVEVLTPKEPVMVFRHVQIQGADVSLAVSAVAEWFRAGGDADPTALNPLDAAVLLREALTLELPARQGFRIDATTDYYRPDLAASATVMDEGVGIWATAMPGGGVRLDLAPEEKGAKRSQIELSSIASLWAKKNEIVESTRRAMAAREAFFARPFTAGHATRVIRQALSEADSAGHGRWEEHVSRDDYSFGWPSAAVRVREATAEGQSLERIMVTLQESNEGVRVSIDDGEPPSVLRSSADLRGALSSLVGRALARRDTLTADALVEGRSYRVIRPMAGFILGEIIRFTRRQMIPRESIEIYEFSSVAREGVKGQLQDCVDSDLAILRKLSLFLEPI
jgi:hypothetical protein